MVVSSAVDVTNRFLKEEVSSITLRLGGSTVTLAPLTMLLVDQVRLLPWPLESVVSLSLGQVLPLVRASFHSPLLSKPPPLPLHHRLHRHLVSIEEIHLLRVARAHRSDQHAKALALETQVIATEVRVGQVPMDRPAPLLQL